MDDPIPEEKFSSSSDSPPNEPPLDDTRQSDQPHPGHSTGPRSSDGKAVSSLNGLKHGCRSEKILLCDEDPVEFDAHMSGWFDQYTPETFADFVLVEETVLAHWLLKRTRRRLLEIERKLPSNPSDWTGDHHREFTNFTRYKTSAERAFWRAFKELEARAGRSLRNAEAREKALVKAAAVEREWARQEEKETAENLKLTQLVIVETPDGECLTTYYPTNQQLLETVAERPSPPAMVIRCIDFSRGLPPEYAWMQPNHMQKVSSTVAVQKMVYSEWLHAIESEKSTGLVGPMGRLDYLRQEAAEKRS